MTCLVVTSQLFPLCIFQIPGNVEYHPKYMLYSKKQHIFLIVYEFSGSATEVVLYRENTEPQTANSKCTTVKGCLTTECLIFLILQNI